MATTKDTADSDAAEIRVAEEDTFNTAPTSKNGTVLRHSGFTVSQDTETSASEEISADRQRTDVVRTGFNTSGDISYELSFGTYDIFFEQVMFSSFEYAHQLSGTISTSKSNDRITSDSTSNGPDFSPIVAGQKIKLNNVSSNEDGVYNVTNVNTSTNSNHYIEVEETISNDVSGDDDETLDYNFQTGTLDAQKSSDTFEVDSTTTGNPTFNGYQVGDWIKVSGFSNDSNNGYFQITNVDTSANTHKITVEQGITNDETGVSGVKLGGRRLENDTTLKSMYFEKEFTDISGSANTYYTGQRIVGWDHSIAAQEKITGSFTVQGINENANNASSQLTGSPASANTNPVFSSTDSVPEFYYNGKSQPIESFSLSMDNSPRTQAIVSQAQPLNIKPGQIGLSGDLSIYLSDPSIYADYTSFTNVDFSVIQEDRDNNAYVIDIYKANFSDGSEDPDSNDSDILTELSWEAFKDDDSDTGKTVAITKIPSGII